MKLKSGEFVRFISRRQFFDQKNGIKRRRLNALSLEDTVVEPTVKEAESKRAESGGAEPLVRAKEKMIREEEEPEGAELIQEAELKEAEPIQEEKTIREEEEPEGAEPLEKEKTIREEAEPIQEEEPKGAEPIQEEQEEEEEPEERRRSRRRKTPTIHTDDDENESLDANGKKWKKPKISGKSPEKEANISSANVTVRRSRRGRASEVTSEDVSVVPKQRKRKAVEEDSDEPTTTPPTSSELPSEGVRPLSRVMTPMLFDETKVGGRFCSTPIRGRDSDTVGDVTFDDVNLSAITENEPVKNRKSHAQYLQQIFEEDEEN